MEKQIKSNEKVERNKAIYEDRQLGMSWSKLCAKYNLTVKTVYAIVNRLARRLNS